MSKCSYYISMLLLYKYYISMVMNSHFTNSLIKVAYHPWLVLLQRCMESFVFANAFIHYPLLTQDCQAAFSKIH